MKILRSLLNKNSWSYGLFWSWNIIFLAFMFLGFVPVVLMEMITAVRTGEIPANFLLYAVILTLIPAFTIGIGFTRLRRRPTRLFALGYGVEGPIMLLLAVRFFVVRQMTSAVALLLITATLGILTYLWQLLDTQSRKRHTALIHLRMIGLTLLLVTGVYAAIWLSFYALPLGIEGVRSIGEFVESIWHELTHLDFASIQWRMVPFTILGIILFVLSATLFVMMPIAVSILYAKAWWQGVKEVTAVSSPIRALSITSAVLLILILLSIPANRQPQHKAFALLETPPSTLAEAEQLLAEEDAIRAGLLNSFLAPQRYISAQGEVRHVYDMYEYTMNLEPESASRVQTAYETIAQPILYKPVDPDSIDPNSWAPQALRTEPQQAAELYQEFFDEPIVDGERDTVIRAARSTWSIDQARANWQAVDDREILLTNQEVTITEHGDWAEFELYEVYQNQTWQRQEAVYYFSLPETAVLTGIWLGNSEDRNNRFDYLIAPRGAAQATYRNEVRRNIDPALLEQIGPSQYRLRAFPVDPASRDWSDRNFNPVIVEGDPLHLWVTWQVMADSDSWPMPHLADKFNVYWTDDSVRLVNGKPVAWDNDTWLPATIAINNPSTPAAHHVTYPDGTTVIAEPVSPNPQSPIPNPQRLALVLDRSRSMVKLENEVESILTNLAAMETAVDIYLTASPIRGEAPSRTTLDELDIENIVYFGGQNPAQLLTQFNELHDGEAYDAILVLTDGSGYELGEPEAPVSIPDSPIWMVHLNGRFPIGYDDDTLTAIQGSGGGAVGSLEDALTRLMAGSGETAVDIIDGYRWSVVGKADTLPANATQHAPTDAFAAFTARRIILAEMAANRGTLDNLETLDALHALAIENSIVTPYSSMIVLVNTRQEELLRELSEKENRFDREFEEIGETTLDPVPITGVPEPEEWLLIGLSLFMLIWYMRRNNTKLIPNLARIQGN